MSTTEHVMSKFLNNPDDIVPESLAGLAAAHPDLVTVDLENQVVLRAGGPVKGKVALVSGGGSGHEPLHGGFVGLGMLDAACAGAVFTSPVPDQMLAGSKAADGGAGVLHIVKNYTGDVLNFKMAADMLDDDGVSVETVLVNDDVAVEDSLYTAGRRGTGATVLLEKIAGAKAEQGASLQEVAAVAQRVNDRARSFGVALSSCTPPSAGSPIFQISPGEIELGVGIHGEPGRRRAQLGSAAEVAAQIGDADPGRPRAGVGLARAGLRQQPGRHAGDRALRAVRRAVEAARRARHRGRAAASSGRTSPAWRWPARPSPCSNLTASSRRCGMHRSTPRRCAGASDRRSDDERPDHHALDGGERLRDRREP